MEAILEPLGYTFLKDGPLLRGSPGRYSASSACTSCCGMSYIGLGSSHSIFGGFAVQPPTQFYILGAGLWGTHPRLRSTQYRSAADWVPTPRSESPLPFALVLPVRAVRVQWSVLRMHSSDPSGDFRRADRRACRRLTARSDFVFVRYRALLFTTFDPDVANVSGVRVGSWKPS